MTIKRNQLGHDLRRHIRQKEAYLDRKCRRIWTGTNPKNEEYMYGSFCRNHDRLIVTIAYRHPTIGWLTEF